MQNHRKSSVLTAAALAVPLLVGISPGGLTAQAASVQASTPAATNPGQVTDVNKEVNNAVKVIDKMKADPKLAKLMSKAKGIFVVPEFGRGALIVGARGGSGLVVTQNNGAWGSPAFYNMGGISVGAQAGGSGGAIAFLLMTPNAVQKFYNKNSFSLNAGAGLSIINYSANAQASLGKGDIILWSDTKGLFAGVQVSVSDIMWDGQASSAYYGRTVNPKNVLTGAVAPPKASPVDTALAK